MIFKCKIAIYFNAETQGAQRELEFRVGERWGVFSHKEQEKQEVSGVGVKSWSWRVELESGDEFFEFGDGAHAFNCAER